MVQNYTQIQACARLFTNHGILIALGRKGWLPCRQQGAKVLYDAAYIDGLAVHLKRTSSSGHFDSIAAALYFLLQQYNNVPTTATRGQRDWHHERVQRQCRALIEAGDVVTAHDLAEAIHLPVQRVRRWALEGRITAVTLGYACYMSRRHYNGLVRLFTVYETVYEAADRHGVPHAVVAAKVDRGQIPAILAPDGLRRLDPAAVDRAMLPSQDPEGLTYGQTAARLRVTVGALKMQVSLGNIRATGWRRSRRIPISEVDRLYAQLTTLNPGFEWLEPPADIRGRDLATMDAKVACQALGVSEPTISAWSQENLLPYYVASLVAEGVVIRRFVRLYIFGLSRFKRGAQTAKEEAQEYARLCQQARCVV